MSAEPHRWIVDEIAEHVARVEVDGEALVALPRWLLPADAVAGDVLRVRHARDGDRSSLVVDRDDDATRAATERSAAQLAEAPLARSDASGDIVL